MASLTPDEKEEIAQLQFGPLDKKWEEIFKEHLANGNLPLGLTKTDLESLLVKDPDAFVHPNDDPDNTGTNDDEVGMFEVTTSIVHTYIRCVAEYVNISHVEKGGGSAVPKIVVVDHFEFLFNDGPVDRAMKTNDWREVDTILNKSGFNIAILDLIDYLFIPLYGKNKSHWMLLGLALKQNYAFFLDPLHGERNYLYPDYLVFKGLVQHIYPNPQAPMDVCGYHAGLRWVDSDDYIKMCPRQYDDFNCGVFACTNAMNLAFGYPTNCYTESDLTPKKRQRMAAELITGGFKNPFNYQLLDIPTDVVVRPPSQLDETSEPSLVEKDAPPDYTLKVAQLVRGKGATSSTVVNISGKQRKFRPRDSSTETEQPAKVKYTTFPSQFSKEYFQLEPFLFAIKKPLCKDLDFGQLIDQCIASTLVGWERWSIQHVEVFRRWVENELAGRIYQARTATTKINELGQDISVTQEDLAIWRRVDDNLCSVPPEAWKGSIYKGFYKRVFRHNGESEEDRIRRMLKTYGSKKPLIHVNNVLDWADWIHEEGFKEKMKNNDRRKKNNTGSMKRVPWDSLLDLSWVEPLGDWIYDDIIGDDFRDDNRKRKENEEFVEEEQHKRRRHS